MEFKEIVYRYSKKQQRKINTAKLKSKTVPINHPIQQNKTDQ